MAHFIGRRRKQFGVESLKKCVEGTTKERVVMVKTENGRF
ncbi:MAG: hypothetical protein ACI8PP_002061 [Candidatus Pseudothioglobus sp.]|jgi:hypothetical protein